jgi:hypothetical protein
VLSGDELRWLSTNGFVTVAAISTAAEVAKMRRILADLLATHADENEGLLSASLAGRRQQTAPRLIL